ncbi:DUF2975 domain-containing protein [Clostridium niameyense]|uniref:DUF2975 domain-containing protein n=1 Tax=Clostridium niameyense TaxID=1622073 RepID=UPI0013D4F6C6|nr:DUF2975 domain-containing protein [Clostridium niameyense]
MKNTNTKSILSTLLYITGIILFITLVGEIGRHIYLIVCNFTFESVVNLITTSIYLYGYFTITRYLIAIVESTYSTPFIENNVSRLRKMGYYLIINVILEGISDFYKKGVSILIGTSNGSIKLSTVMGIILALMCFVIAEVFEKAIKMKEENDLTI